MPNAGGIDIALVQHLPVLGRAAEDHLRQLAAAASFQTVASRTILFSEGNRVDRLFVLKRGSVELFSQQDDRRFTISVLRSARLLELCSIFAGRHSLSARVLEPSEFVAVRTELIRQLIRQDAAFADAAVHELARQSLEIIDEFKKHRLLNTTARIAHWMLQVDAESEGHGRIVIPFDKRVLASYLGMTPEQLSRGFASLRSAGVSVDGRSVTIADRHTLTRVATRELTGMHARSC